MAESYIGLPAADVEATRLRTQQVIDPTNGAVQQEVHTLAAPDGTLLDPGLLAKDASLQSILANLASALAKQTAILTALQGTLAVSGTVAVTDGAGSLTVDATTLPLPTGAAKDSTLTDGTQRVGGTVAVTGPVTDAQLRATPVPVSGAVTVDGTVAVSGTPNVAVTSIPEVEVKNDSGNPLAVKDDFTTGECLADQSGAGAVLTFTFSSAVQGFWVVDTSSQTTAISRVDPFGGTPTASTGFPVFNGQATPFYVTTTTVKVYAPTGTSISVTGFRR